MKTMKGGEFSGYITGSVINRIAEPIASFFVQVMQFRLSGQVRGFWDYSLAGLANGLNVPCPQCKNVTSWQDGTIRVKIKKER